jgi:predicted DCC family thiol-disulfide oxidoreductase YuxK
MKTSYSSKVILFDGYCGLCNNSVNWVISKDTNLVFKYSTIQGEYVKGLDLKFISPQNPDSIIFLNDLISSDKSTAALLIAKELPYPWKLLYSFIIVPRPIRDFVYDLISRNRYRWFGKLDHCRLPTPNEKHLFLD